MTASGAANVLRTDRILYPDAPWAHSLRIMVGEAAGMVFATLFMRAIAPSSNLLVVCETLEAKLVSTLCTYYCRQ
jgi:hypothetical protein